MKCKVLTPFKVETSNRVVDLPPGKLVNLANDTAMDLIMDGKVAPVDAALKIHSKLLGEYIWIVETGQGIDRLREQGISEPIYTKEELTKLKGMDVESIKAIHEVKKVFECSKIIRVERSPA